MSKMWSAFAWDPHMYIHEKNFDINGKTAVNIDSVSKTDRSFVFISYVNIQFCLEIMFAIRKHIYISLSWKKGEYIWRKHIGAFVDARYRTKKAGVVAFGQYIVSYIYANRETVINNFHTDK